MVSTCSSHLDSLRCSQPISVDIVQKAFIAAQEDISETRSSYDYHFVHHKMVRYSGRGGIDVYLQQNDVHNMDKSPMYIQQPPNEKLIAQRTLPVF
jgi:hypothetical protein